MAIVSRIGEISESDKTVEPLQLPLADPRGAEIETKYLSVFSSADERHEAGFWQTEVGKSRWEFDDGGEIIYVLGGAMTVERDGHPSIEVKAGDLVVFETGWQGFWTVTEPLSKVYVFYS